MINRKGGWGSLVYIRVGFERFVGSCFFFSQKTEGHQPDCRTVSSHCLMRQYILSGVQFGILWKKLNDFIFVKWLALNVAISSNHGLERPLID